MPVGRRMHICATAGSMIHPCKPPAFSSTTMRLASALTHTPWRCLGGLRACSGGARARRPGPRRGAQQSAAGAAQRGGGGGRAVAGGLWLHRGPGGPPQETGEHGQAGPLTTCSCMHCTFCREHSRAAVHVICSSTEHPALQGVPYMQLQRRAYKCACVQMQKLDWLPVHRVIMHAAGGVGAGAPAGVRCQHARASPAAHTGMPQRPGLCGGQRQ